MSDELVCPLNKVLHVGRVGVPAIVLAPGKLAVEQTRGSQAASSRCDSRLPDSSPLAPSKREHAARGHRRHEAPLVVEPIGVALFGDSVADEREARRAQRDQFVGVNRNIAGFLLPNVASDAPYFMKLPAIQ